MPKLLEHHHTMHIQPASVSGIRHTISKTNIRFWNMTYVFKQSIPFLDYDILFKQQQQVDYHLAPWVLNPKQASKYYDLPSSSTFTPEYPDTGYPGTVRLFYQVVPKVRT